MPKQLSDAILLERFVNRREEAAFVTLVERHGALVEGVCRRVLRDDHDVEDVYQATFLVLARKASCVPWRGSVGGWLRAVAHRLALHARADLGRRRTRESLTSALARSAPYGDNPQGSLFGLPEQFHPLVDPSVELESRDLRCLIEDELRQMPEKYRAPVVLCDLEGKTHQEAARTLGWPAGSISRRLERARGLLRQRLSDRGVSLGVLLVGICLAVYGIRSMAFVNGHAAWEIRQAMVCFKPPRAGGQGLESTLAELLQGRRDLPHSQLANLARRSAQVALKLEEHQPAKQPEQWREWTVEMHRSAIQLALASRASDEPAILAAARELNTSCLKCHEIFRQ
ncbi:MAG: RNA polymerase sigma factor [Isosphaeraceae bacterium]